MKLNFTLLLLFFFCINVYAQKDHKYVKLSEEKKGKRLTLYATNTDSISYDVFLKVDTKDYRRSSNRPIIKTIPANSRVKLLTLIQLANTAGNYNSIFVVNEVSYAMHLNKDHDDFNIKIDEELKNKKVTLFTRTNCLICPKTKRILNKNKIAYTEYNIDKDSTTFIKMIKTLQKDEQTHARSKIPILKVEDKVYSNIKSTKDFVTALREAFK